ncbi:MAG: NAD-dependent DNA ligase LigA [Clostridia bacterium]
MESFFEEDDKKRIDYLRKKIKEYNIMYYEEDSPVITDFEYDKLNKELRSLERQYPEYIDKDNITRKIGGKNKNIFSSVEHFVQMQSLNDVFNIEEVIDYIKKTGEDYEYSVETKIDGLSVSLEYDNGKLVIASTRGDGFVGENITDNILKIKSIPQTIDYLGHLEVRGEVYLPLEELERINIELDNQNKKVLSNSRNAAAGTLRQLDSKLVEKRKLSIFIFNVQKCDKEFVTHTESLEFCKSLGFNIIEYMFKCRGINEIINSIEKIGNLREQLPYDMDGAVVKINDLKLREEIGKTEKVPKWAVAYKYPPIEKETTILDVITAVGRTGKITPMAVMTPVHISGSIVSKATLHNFSYIKQKDIKIGDICVIRKAGEVIPEVVSVIKEKRNNVEDVIPPTNCPVCGSLLEVKNNDLICNNDICSAKIHRNITHFASRECMDISGLGENIVEKLIDSDRINDVADIYYLKYSDLIDLENFKEKSVNNLLDAINNTKNNSLDKLIFGLGIKNICKKASKVLNNNFSDIFELINASYDTLINLDDFGDVMAESIIEYFKVDDNIKVINKLKDIGVNLKGEKIKLTSNKLSNLIFCITGSFDISRDNIIKLIEENNGKCINSVSKKLDYLVSGEESGSKLASANKLNIKVITLNELYNLLEVKNELV